MYRTFESTSHVLLPWFHDYYIWVEKAKVDILFNLVQTQIPNDIHKICTSVFSFLNNTHSMRNRQIIAFVAWAWLRRWFYSITIQRKCPVKTSLSDSRAETAGLTHPWAPPGNRPCPAGTIGAAPRVVRRCSPSPQTQAAGDKEPYRTVPQTCGWAPQSPWEAGRPSSGSDMPLPPTPGCALMERPHAASHVTVGSHSHSCVYTQKPSAAHTNNKENSITVWSYRRFTR